MEIDFDGEFGNELLLVIPYAYCLHVKGDLKSTVSSKFTKELYFFSEKHEEKYTKRRHQILRSFPNNTLNCQKFDYRYLHFPDYKKQFANELFFGMKPLLIVHNKYTMEWNGPPINFINIDTLRYIFENYRERYHIIYSRLGSKSNDEHIVEDHQGDFAKGDFADEEEELLKQHSITKVQDLYRMHQDSANNFNHFQLLLHSKCENFVSVQGGTSALASYFGGKNLIYAVRGSEVRNRLYDSNNLFSKVSDQSIFRAKSYDEMVRLLKQNFPI